MNILKNITTLIGWLAGSLTAISALLCVFGFIVVRSQSNLLGLGDFLRYTNDQYLIEGAQFLLHTTIYANEIILRLATLILLIIAIPLYVFPKTSWWNTFLSRCRARADLVWEKCAWLVSAAAIALLFYIFLARFIPYLDAFKEPTELRDLLTSATTVVDTVDTCKAERPDSIECLRRYIILGKRAELEGLYFNLSLFYFEAVVVLSLVYHFSVNWQGRTMIRLPFVAIFLAYTLLLPMCYGVLIKPITLSPLNLTFAANSKELDAGNLYLLQKSENAFIAWSSSQRKIIWYPAGSVVKATIGSRQQLFPLPNEIKDGSL